MSGGWGGKVILDYCSPGNARNTSRGWQVGRVAVWKGGWVASRGGRVAVWKGWKGGWVAEVAGRHGGMAREGDREAGRGGRIHSETVLSSDI